MGRKFVFECVLVIYHIKALVVVIRTTLKISKKFSVEKNWFDFFLIFRLYFELIKRASSFVLIA